MEEVGLTVVNNEFGSFSLPGHVKVKVHVQPFNNTASCPIRYIGLALEGVLYVKRGTFKTWQEGLNGNSTWQCDTAFGLQWQAWDKF